MLILFEFFFLVAFCPYKPAFLLYLLHLLHLLHLNHLLHLLHLIYLLHLIHLLNLLFLIDHLVVLLSIAAFRVQLIPVHREPVEEFQSGELPEDHVDLLLSRKVDEERL